MTSPTVRRRRLSAELRRRRMQAGMTLNDVADMLDWSPAKLGHIETGIRKWPSVVEVSALLQLYGVTGGQREAILTLARQSRMRPWWTDYDDVISSAYVGNEAGAVAVDTYAGIILPDLVQVPEYTALLARMLGRDERGTERTIAAYARRQELLDQDSLQRYHAVVEEEALRRVYSRLRHRQVEHLIELCELGGPVVIQLAPTSAGPHVGCHGPFTILEFDEGEDALAFVDAPQGGAIVESADSVQGCQRVWRELTGLAWDRDTSLRALKQLALLA